MMEKMSMRSRSERLRRLISSLAAFIPWRRARSYGDRVAITIAPQVRRSSQGAFRRAGAWPEVLMNSANLRTCTLSSSLSSRTAR